MWRSLFQTRPRIEHGGNPARCGSPFNRLLALLSVIAGSADVTSFLGFGLFSAHVTGNLVILTAHIVARKADDACLILSVPLLLLSQLAVGNRQPTQAKHNRGRTP